MMHNSKVIVIFIGLVTIGLIAVTTAQQQQQHDEKHDNDTIIGKFSHLNHRNKPIMTFFLI